jgi:NAD(P)H-dependent FMN reductase
MSTVLGLAGSLAATSRSTALVAYVLEGLSAAHGVYATDADLETFPTGPLPTVVTAQLQALADELALSGATRG